MAKMRIIIMLAVMEIKNGIGKKAIRINSGCTGKTFIKKTRFSVGH
jgi:hypothetical protein